MSTKAHAQHNKDACEFLLANTKFHDWVVTTAFYSAMHYVQSRIFPYNDGTTTFTDIDVYVDHINAENRKAKRNTISKHRAVIKLVERQLPSIQAEYRKLFDTCMNARYYMYKMQKAYATDAQQELLIIEQHCYPPAAPKTPKAKK